MTAAFFLASLLVAFVAGIVALAMPCCFSVLLPAYLAKSFDRVRGRLVMTGIFALGIAVILLPIALGANELTAFLGVNHPLLFVLGGGFMVVLGAVTLGGIEIVPQFRLEGDLQRRDAPSVFALGVFSGVASSCCAPVLLGVVVLTAVSGSLVQAGVVGTAYVMGMVFPLLVAATVWDRRGRRLTGALGGRRVTLRLGAREFSLHSSKLIAGLLFVGMGVMTVALGVADRMIPVPGSELLGIYQHRLEVVLTEAFSNPWVLGGLVAGGLGLLAYVLLRQLRWSRLRTGPRASSTGAAPTGTEDDP